MKVLIFGATGSTGKHLLQQAVEKGYQVTAVVRNPAKLNVHDKSVTVVQGDVLDESTFRHAVKGQDAVFCCLGAPAGKAGTVRSSGTKNIIHSMKASGVNRFICMTSLGFDDSTATLKQTPFLFRKVFAPFLLKSTFEEHHLQENAIKDSALNWTIVRPGNLTNGKKTEAYKYAFDYNDKNIKVKVSRADVADFMIRQLNTDTFSKRTVGISY